MASSEVATAPRPVVEAAVITGVESFVLPVDVVKPATTGSKRKFVSGVLVLTDAGITGTGISAMASLPNHALRGEVLGYVSGLLVGQDLTRVRQLAVMLERSKLSQLGGVGVGVRSLVDIAAWDALAQSLGAPLFRVLGQVGPVGPPTYITVGDPDWEPGRVVEGAAALAALGWGGIKIKVGRPDPVVDVQVLRAVREAVGEQVSLMADATQLWSLSQAERFARGVRDLSLEWLEEPCDCDDVASYRELRLRTGVRLAVGENFSTVAQFTNILAQRAVDVAQPDACRLPGMTAWLEVATQARLHGVDVVPHHSDFAQLHQHGALARVGVPWIEFPWGNELFSEQVQRQTDGRMVLPRSPGAGTSLRQDALQKARFATTVT